MKPFVTPIEYHKLPYNKRLDIVIRAYIIKCTCEQLFINKKLNNVYFAVRKVFAKKEPTELQILYDYLYTVDKKIMHYEDLYNSANRYLSEQNFKRSQEMQKSQPKVEQESYYDILMKHE